MIFEQLLKTMELPAPVKEYQFAKDAGRKWRMDYAWPEHKLALEVEGGVWTRGRHTRGAGFVKDMEKYNTATSMGWRILRVTPSDLLKLNTIQLIQKSLNK